ncbi:MAG: polyribonucleotide nucleotidyltransferase [Nitrospirota bacterium]|nr:polyribonucleotide nucleotidyltransferase [Nitrospirota bacterium]
MPITVQTEIGGRVLSLETGKMAKQAGGAVVVRYGDSVVLATAVAAKSPRPGTDFFPLTVDYQEKAFAAGKIPGSFFRREGRPSEKEILTSRLIDRPMRPLFPDGFYCDTQVIASVLSLGDEGSTDIMAMVGGSAALSISDVPFFGPVGSVRVGRIDGAFVINPSLKQAETSDLNIVVAGTKDAVMMVECGADELPEEIILQAIDFGHKELQKVIALQEELVAKAGKPKREVPATAVPADLKNEVLALALDRIREAVLIPNKTERQNTLDIILDEAVAKLKNDDSEREKNIRIVFHDAEKSQVRRMITEKGVRADGRGTKDIRPISCEVGILPRTHGSALFTRGETQGLVVVTLGTSADEQRVDALEGEVFKAFMLHYNFPPFSVGEARPLRSPGRREVGHGALAERAVKAVSPAKADFPYTIRIVSDILESNGSSSMATVCGSTLALMDAGVPIKAPVAGIAMGLIKEPDSTAVLSDILGVEDHLGDMDFKVCGTEKGVTALQMDIKIAGIDNAIMKTALEQAREGRMYILGKMLEAISAPRPTLSMHAPRIYTMMIKQDKIREVIGTGGKVIRGIVEQTGVKIDIEDSGLVSIASADAASAQKAIDIINGICAEAEVGKIYLGKVKKITDFGAFVEILPGTDGLVHISQLAEHRVANVTDVIKEGEEVLVKVIEVDKQGKIRLSRKEALREQDGATVNH